MHYVSTALAVVFRSLMPARLLLLPALRLLLLPALHLLLLPALSIGMLSGCGSDGPDISPVRGKVTFQGKPVTTGRVMFYPSEGRASNGPIDSDGTYQLREGALVGSHKVTIQATKVIGAAPGPKNFEEELQGIGITRPKGPEPRVVWLVPQTYSQRRSSPLTAEVVSGDENMIDFELVE